MSAVRIRPYHPDDVSALIETFRRAVREIACRDYNESQTRAWAPDFIDETEFTERCAQKETWIGEVDRHVAGFSDMEADGHIDMLYVHPAFQRRGVARSLLEHIQNIARSRGIMRLYSEASITALPAFLACGFIEIAAQTVTVRGERFTNFRIERML